MRIDQRGTGALRGGRRGTRRWWARRRQRSCQRGVVSAAVIGIARKTRSAEITSFGGLFEYAPGLTVVLSLFLFSLARIPPLGGWLAKFVVFRALADANTTSGYVMGAIVAVNSVIALYYYANIAREMWMKPVPDGDRTSVVVPFSIGAALCLSVVATVAFGVSDIATRLGDEATFLLAL